jgi:hypothetical protein
MGSAPRESPLPASRRRSVGGGRGPRSVVPSFRLAPLARARAGLDSAIQSHDPAKMADANLQLSSQVTILNRSVTEAYPQLKSDQAFLRLQDELTGTENRIAVARNGYNQAAEQYNAYIRQFPAVITARVIGAKGARSCAGRSAFHCGRFSPDH